MSISLKVTEHFKGRMREGAGRGGAEGGGGRGREGALRRGRKGAGYRSGEGGPSCNPLGGQPASITVRLPQTQGPTCRLDQAAHSFGWVSSGRHVGEGPRAKGLLETKSVFSRLHRWRPGRPSPHEGSWGLARAGEEGTLVQSRSHRVLHSPDRLQGGFQAHHQRA